MLKTYPAKEQKTKDVTGSERTSSGTTPPISVILVLGFETKRDLLSASRFRRALSMIAATGRM